MASDDHSKRVKRQLEEAQKGEFSGKFFINRPRKHLDPHIAPQNVKNGECRLCGKHADLSEDHVPPRTMGNRQARYARSWIKSVTGNAEFTAERRFPKGVVFRTICKVCNSSLGAHEDAEIGSLYSRVRWRMQTNLDPFNNYTLSVKPNLIFRGIMAHLCAANDKSITDNFDQEAKDIFSGKRACSSTNWNLYYWPYVDPRIFVMKAGYVGFIGNAVSTCAFYVLKSEPLAFAFCDKEVMNFPNLKNYLQPDDNLKCDIPLRKHPADRNPVWPIEASDRSGTIVMTSANSFGMLARY